MEKPTEEPILINTDGGPQEAVAGAPDVSVLRTDRRPAPTFPLYSFGPLWGDWIAKVANGAACPADYVVAALLPTASAVIGNARWAQAGPSWREPPHLWCAAVGHSGQGKSPGADIMHRHVVPSIEASMQADYELRLAEYRAKLLPDDMASFTEPWRNLSVPLQEMVDESVPPAPRFILNDVTVEKVAAVVAEAAPKGLLMSRDELAGWFLGMGAFNSSARAFWLETYGGRPYQVDRVKHPKPIKVQHLAVAWYGGIQPARLAEVMQHADDGLLARFCWFWPETIPFRLTTTAPDIEFAIKAFDRLRMLDLAPPVSPEVPGGPIMIPLSQSALGELESFAQEMQSRQDLCSGLMVSALGKARGLVLRLSLVLEHLAWAAKDGFEAAPTEISVEAFHGAVMMVREYFMPMAERVYGDAATTQLDRNVAALARWIMKERPIEVHVRHLQREVRLTGLADAPSIHAACQPLIEAGWLVPPARGGRDGRARAAYRVRSELWAALDAQH